MGLEDDTKKDISSAEEILKSVRANLHSDIIPQQEMRTYVFELGEKIKKIQNTIPRKEYEEFENILENVSEAFEKIQENNQRLQSLVSGDGEHYFLKTTHAYPLMNDLYETMSILKQGAGINLKQNYSCLNEAQITTNKEAFRQIMYNFLENAYTHANSKNITLGARDEGHAYNFFVEDDGIGIKRSEQEKIFEGERLKTTRSSKGIGLKHNESLAKKINAEIRLESEENKGSTFSLYIQKNHDSISQKKY